jgi:predicted N-acetyltransferase YhbS
MTRFVREAVAKSGVVEGFVYFRKNRQFIEDITLDNIILRLEWPEDHRTVEKLTYEAFRNAEHASGDEAFLARKLRDIPAFVAELDYVAEAGGKVIGNIMYTRSKIVSSNGEEWETLTFGPLSVLPEYQKRGVGAALVSHTLQLARKMGFRAVLIFGHESYYPRFGFREASAFHVTTDSGENFPAFMALPLYEGALSNVSGKLMCDPVFFSLEKEEKEAFKAEPQCQF